MKVKLLNIYIKAEQYFLHHTKKLRSIMIFVYYFRYIIVLFILIMALVFSLHFSSISIWDDIIPGDEQQKSINILGKGRSIRSDEFISSSVIRLSQTKSTEFFPLFNNNFEPIMNMFISGAPVFDISLIGRPQYWGFFFLGTERGFSWYWWFRLLLLIITSFELFLYLTNNRKGFALVGSILISFSPLVQWWFNESFIDLIIFFQLDLVCLILYFKFHESILKKIFCLIGMAIGLCGFAFSFFPAVTLPLLVLLLILIGGILWINWKNINKLDWIMAGCCIFFVLFVISFTFLHSLVEIKNTLNIDQAKRFLFPGGYDIRHQMYEYFSLALPFKDINFLNNCEVSRFVTLMPLTLFLFPLLLFKNNQIKSNYVLPIIIYVLLLVLCVWAYIPMPSIVGKLFSQLTLLFSTTRVHILIGLFGVYLLVIILSLRDKVKISVNEKWMLSLISGCCILYALYTPQVKEYLKSYITPVTLFFLFVMFLLIWGKPKLCAIILGVSVLGSGVFINPLAHGLDSIYKKPISIEIEKIRYSEPQAHWIIMTELHHSFLPALGVKCFNTVQLLPSMEKWKLFDPDDEYIDIYNRYCFVRTAFTDEKTYFLKNQDDLITLFLNIKELPLTKAKYIYTDRELEKWSTDETFLQQVYLDPYSSYRIYIISNNHL